MWVVGQRHATAALPLGKIRYPLYSRLGGPQGRSGRVRKILPPPEFVPRTVQSVASRYTDCTVQKCKFRPGTDHKDPQGEGSYSSTSSLTSDLDRPKWTVSRFGRFTPGKKTYYQFDRRVRWHKSWCGRVSKFSLGLKEVRSPNRPARSQSLYRLSYHGYSLLMYTRILMMS